MRFIPLAEPWLTEDCATAVANQVRTSFVGPGKACATFSGQICDRLRISHAVLTTSGTVALTVAAIALGLKPGDEILVPAYGVISTINAFAVMGLKPKLVDIDRLTGCMDPEALRQRISASTKAICFVNFSGYTGSNLTTIAGIAASNNIPLIEDAACAFGHVYEGKAAGTFGAIGVLSFSVPKVLTTGQGGCIVTARQDLVDRALEYIDHGDLHWRETNLNHGIGTNLRFTDVLAALGSAQMKTLDERLARRRSSHGAMREELGPLMYEVPGEQAPLHNIVFAENPEALVRNLRDRNVGAVRQYRSIYQHPAYAHLNDDSFPNADFWTDHSVYLPFGLAMDANDGRRVGLETRRANVELIDLAKHA